MARKPIEKKELEMGSLIRKLREERGFSQEDFARHIGIDRGYYGRIERGEASVTLHKISLIAKSLGLAKWELLKKLDEDGN
jgi:transcriptional regulator with XRE-family HTH domain